MYTQARINKHTHTHTHATDNLISSRLSLVERRSLCVVTNGVLALSVPDSVVLQVLSQRLSALDCTTRGWVLHGFPREPEQARRLQDSTYKPSRYSATWTREPSLVRLTYPD